MAERRVVRAPPNFFALIDAQHGDERDSNDEPTSAEFEANMLFAIIDRFATGWDDLPQQFPGRPESRLLIAAGRLVPMAAVTVQPEGPIKLTDITIDLHGPWK